jgi:hypothetical protein
VSPFLPGVWRRCAGDRISSFSWRRPLRGAVGLSSYGGGRGADAARRARGIELAMLRKWASNSILVFAPKLTEARSHT